MACTRYKNRNYKSAIQFYNATPQLITVDSLVTNPLTLAIGNIVTDTGCAFSVFNNGIYTDVSGLYGIDVDVNLEGTVAGEITFAIALNGEILPETLRTVTTVADAFQTLHMSTVRPLNVCNTFGQYNYSVVAFSDGTATGTVQRVSGNVVKLA